MAEDDIDALVQRTGAGGGQGPYTNYKGCFLPERYITKYAEKIDNLEVNDSDIWVATFPKAGTTWLQEMVHLIANDCNYEKADCYLTQRFPFLELGALCDYDSDPSRDCTVNGFEHFRKNSVEYAAQFKERPRPIKTHLPYFLLPKSIQNREKRPKILHVIRNPKDVCVSYYYHSITADNYSGTFEEFCRLFLAGKVVYAPFWNNVLSYWRRRHEPNILLVRYEEMKSDLRSVTLKVAAFLDKTLAEDQIERLSKHLDFQSMKNNKHVNYEVFKGKHIRKGIVGDHKNMMSKDIIKAFDEWIEQNDEGIFG